MKKISLFLIGCCLVMSISYAQTNIFPSSGSTGIGTTTPASSAILDVQSTTQGILIPRMTKVQRDAILSPVSGLMIFQTNSSPGFYYYNGAGWTPISTKGANTSLSNLVTTTSINQHLQPNADNSLDLGSITKNWNELFVNTIRFMDGTTQSTASAGGGTTYTAGTGIGIVSGVISNTGDTNVSDDITNATSAAGDLSGTFPSLTVAKIRGVNVSATAPVLGQVLKYNSLTSSWEPGLDNNTIYSSGTGLTLTGTIFSLANTAVTAGTYGSSTNVPQITVDAQGRVTAVTNVAVTGGGAETDPQVGSNTIDRLPRWDGAALVAGKIQDNGNRIAVGGDITTTAKASFYNKESGFSTENIAVRAIDHSIALGGAETIYASGFLGYEPDAFALLPVNTDHIGVWGQQFSGGGEGAGIFGYTTGNGLNNYAMIAASSATGTTNFALLAKSTGAGTVNRGIWVEASGGSFGNYALVVPNGGGNSGFGWATPNTIVGIQQDGATDPFRIINEGFSTDFIVTDDGKVGIGMDPTGLSGTFSVEGTQYVSSRLAIGTGVATTTSELTVSGTDETITIEGTNPYLEIENGGDKIGYIRASGVDFQVATNAENTSGRIVFRTDANTRMYIDHSGNIVMGSTSIIPATGYKLSVDGKIMCEELRVELSPWPDYVFQDAYDLMPLSEVAAYINTNQHLPGIPDAATIEGEGLHVGEMQGMMMEKIEELTLYIIELQAQIDALKAENE
jgi:hypothetical protein